MAKVKNKESVAVVNADFHCITYPSRLSTFLLARAIAHIGTAAERDITFQQFTSLFTESFHSPLTLSIDAVHTGIGTKAQQALKLQQEAGKQARKKRSRAEKEAEQERRFAQRQEKRKAKHRGH